MATLAEHLRVAARTQPERTAYVFVRGERAWDELTVAQVYHAASRVAAALADRGAAGERVLLIQPSPVDYIASFFGALLAGAVPVSAYPIQRGRLEATLPPLDAACADCRPALALGTSAAAAIVERHRDRSSALAATPLIATDELEEGTAADPLEESRPDDLAYIQYTSGSTTAPRGVMITHENFLANLELQRRVIPVTPTSRIVSWLPLSHDMGFVGPVLHPIVTGCLTVLLSPIGFVVRPRRWLQAISDFRGTIAGGPNFAYELVARRVSPEELVGVDLSSWQAAMNGAEPVRAETMERFTALCAPAGFRREALLPAFGLSEVVCMATGGGPGARPVVRGFDRASLGKGRVVPSNDSIAAKQVVGCGDVAPGHEVRIVDAERRILVDPGAVGEIWIRGPSVARGYWAKTELSRRTFGARLEPNGEGPFLRTGDLGFLHEGQLFITGRLKDAIVVRGLNHLPHDVEATVGACHPSLDPDGAAAFMAFDGGSAEGCVVVVELAEDADVDRERLRDEIARAVAAAHGLPLSGVAFVAPGALPRTQSGKLQRQACRAAFEAGTLDGRPAAEVVA